MEAPDCSCFTLCIDNDWNGRFSGRLKLESPASRMVDTRKVARHDTRCPVAERARIRRKLLAEISRLEEPEEPWSGGAETSVVVSSYLRAALDRIFPIDD